MTTSTGSYRPVRRSWRFAATSSRAIATASSPSRWFRSPSRSSTLGPRYRRTAASTTSSSDLPEREASRRTASSTSSSSLKAALLGTSPVWHRSECGGPASALDFESLSVRWEHESTRQNRRRRASGRLPAPADLLRQPGERTRLRGVLEGEVFEPPHDRSVFAQVSVDPVAGTIYWPNGGDLHPDVLHGDHDPATGRGPTVLKEYHLRPAGWRSILPQITRSTSAYG